MDIKELFQGLQDGKRYITKSSFMLEAELYASGKHRYFIPQAQLFLIDDIDGQKKIKWHNFGSSAHKNTIDGLEWLLKVIFNNKTAADFVELPN